MPVLILADIHGNLPALEAVLATPEAQRCSEVISLGDHVNFGPQSRAVHDRLRSIGARMLQGNHEERLTHPDDAGFDGYNWALMRWTARQMQGADVALPLDLCRDGVIFTHGTPGDPYHLVYPSDLPAVLDALPQDTRLLISGHNHHRWDMTHGGKRAFNPGSVGMAEDGTGSVAPFAVLQGHTLTRHEVPYDVSNTLRAYLTTGAYLAAPQMCRQCAHVMQTADYQGVLKLIRHVASVGQNMGLTLADEAAWQAADATFHWAEPLSTPQYWAMMKEKLL